MFFGKVIKQITKQIIQCFIVIFNPIIRRLSFQSIILSAIKCVNGFNRVEFFAQVRIIP